ncbi:4'-phosphopantetheinyl transferase superfamily protein [Streptacidiphilus sp. N1-3]|uniref:4'-phosphopantetheinyl transferase superfamily protein n=1 Tax=Streptacidiphilus alkalitolerans TaxID=3342712 RepID=A0ABV6X642_9ACTN
MTGSNGVADAVQVWLVPDQRSEATLTDLLAVLDAEERRRADAYRSADDRRRFIVAHGAVRHIVSRCLGAPAEELRWQRGPHGKPELTGRWTGTQVNLSHSDEVSMVAVSTTRRVGVDVQRVLPRVDATAMANRYFPPEEIRLIRAAPDAESRADRFARLWARKEALVKAHGGRLTQGLRIPVHTPGRVPGSPDAAWSRGYRITDVPAPRGYRAAVALAGPGGYRVVWRRWTWPGPAAGGRTG